MEANYIKPAATRKIGEVEANLSGEAQPDWAMGRFTLVNSRSEQFLSLCSPQANGTDVPQVYRIEQAIPHPLDVVSLQHHVVPT